jgi:hypothetical protein
MGRDQGVVRDFLSVGLCCWRVRVKQAVIVIVAGSCPILSKTRANLFFNSSSEGGSEGPVLLFVRWSCTAPELVGGEDEGGGDKGRNDR